MAIREKVLLVGEANTSKTLSIVSLALLYPDKRVVIFDPDDGTSKVIDELGIGDLPNLTVVQVGTDWKEMVDTYRMAKDLLQEGDWFCMDMLGRFWDLAQQYFSLRVFGTDPAEHILKLRSEAGKVNFGGFDGLTDWTVIKRLHNEQFMDDAVIRSKFNVMATTSSSTYLPIEKVPKVGTEGVYAAEFGIKPEGEKHLIYRFDTQAVLYRKDNKYFFRIVRDRGRAVDVKLVHEFTGRNFWEAYTEFRNIGQ